MYYPLKVEAFARKDHSEKRKYRQKLLKLVPDKRRVLTLAGPLVDEAVAEFPEAELIVSLEKSPSVYAMQLEWKLDNDERRFIPLYGNVFTVDMAKLVEHYDITVVDLDLMCNVYTLRDNEECLGLDVPVMVTVANRGIKKVTAERHLLEIAGDVNLDIAEIYHYDRWMMVALMVPKGRKYDIERRTKKYAERGAQAAYG